MVDVAQFVAHHIFELLKKEKLMNAKLEIIWLMLFPAEINLAV